MSCPTHRPAAPVLLGCRDSGLPAAGSYTAQMAASVLTRWFREHRRRLPWRVEPRDPYRVLVSELMLQQTQVDRVAPKYEAFVARFPDLEALAAAGEDEVVAAWSGLGYYRRARQLHRLAREVVEGGAGLPRTASGLERLPGVGPYTAAAVASLAFGEATPVLDGNVLRVAARMLELEGDVRTQAAAGRARAWVSSLLEGQDPGELNESLMELGATVCTPTSPRCDRCPLAPECRARAVGRQDELPAPRQTRAVEDQRWVAACAVDPEGRWLLCRVDSGPILRGLWLPPYGDLPPGADPATVARLVLPGCLQSVGAEILPAVQHRITYRRIQVIPILFESTPIPQVLPDNWLWSLPDAPTVPTSSLLAKLVDTSRQPRLPMPG